jgi:hypothetical protein
MTRCRVSATLSITFLLVLSGSLAPNTAIGAPSPQNAGAQEIDLGKQNAVPFQVVRSEARAPINLNSERDFEVRLKSGGTVVLSESDLTTGEPNFSKRGMQFMALDTLELRKGARIVTGGNDLVIFANKIISEDGSIVAFTEKTRKATDATQPGGAGAPGVSGGTVTLIAVNGVDGRLHVDLSGQDGGTGQKGAPGAPGAHGAKGEDASSGPLGCNHGGGGGLPGSDGQKGATGGPGGNSGSGGSFFLYNVGDKPVPTAVWEFKAIAGAPGNTGPGGDGGAGGAGGDGGNGGGFCGGGPPGASGHNGPSGEIGPEGRKGSDGNSLSKNMDMQLLIKTAKEIPLNQSH